MLCKNMSCVCASKERLYIIVRLIMEGQRSTCCQNVAKTADVTFVFTVQIALLLFSLGKLRQRQ